MEWKGRRQSDNCSSSALEDCPSVFQPADAGGTASA